eukprot:976158-Karenia_brevis.AAC.1
MVMVHDDDVGDCSYVLTSIHMGCQQRFWNEDQDERPLFLLCCHSLKGPFACELLTCSGPALLDTPFDVKITLDSWFETEEGAARK